MAYEHLFSNAPIERELIYKSNQPERVYFKRLTAGERMALKRGQKGTIKEGQSSFEVDLGDQDSRNHQFLAFANCDAGGKPIFKHPGEVAKLPGDLVDALIALAQDALKEDPAGNA